jgi:hypothetical protein
MRPEMLPSPVNLQPDIVGTPLGAVGLTGLGCCFCGGGEMETVSALLPPRPNNDMVVLFFVCSTAFAACFAFASLSRFAFSAAAAAAASFSCFNRAAFSAASF